MQPGYGQQPGYGMQPPPLPPNIPGKSKVMISIICGAASLFLGVMLSPIIGAATSTSAALGGYGGYMTALILEILGLILAVVGLIAAIMGGKEMRMAGAPAGMATAGLVLCILGMVFCFIFTIGCAVCTCGACQINSAVTDLTDWANNWSW